MEQAVLALQPGGDASLLLTVPSAEARLLLKRSADFVLQVKALMHSIPAAWHNAALYAASTEPAQAAHQQRIAVTYALRGVCWPAAA